METNLQWDDMKAAWQALDRRLERQHAATLELLRDRRGAAARRRLRPLVVGQVLQVALGLLMIALGVSVWTTHADAPGPFVSGLIVHAYGVLAIALAGITLALLGRLDFAAPVLVIQQRLARLRRFYILCGLAVGLVWWLFWIPFTIALFAWLADIDLYAGAPHLLATWLPVGLAGLLATWGLHRWARRPGRARFARLIDDAMAGTSLRRAQAMLEEIRCFEREA